MILFGINPAEIVNQLFPNLWIFIAHLLATIVLLLLLTKWVYNPFRKAMRARRKIIQDKLDDAAIKQAVANAEKIQSTKLLNQAKTEADAIIVSAKYEAEHKKIIILNDAQQEIQNLNKQAKIAIAQNKIKEQENIKNAIISLAFDAADNILKKEIDQKEHKKLINDFIKELE